MQEMTALVQQILEEVNEKKTSLAPQIRELRNIRKRFKEEIQPEYEEKKKEYDAIVGNLESEKERLTSDMGNMFFEYKESESKFHANNVQADIYETFQKRIANEAKFLSNPDKRLSAEFKSYQEFFNAKLRQQENIMKDLRAHQRHIKDNTENYAS